MTSLPESHFDGEEEIKDSPQSTNNKLSVSPSRKRLRTFDSDDDSDYPSETSRYSLSPCPSPVRWTDNSFSTPPLRRKIESTDDGNSKIEEINYNVIVPPLTPASNFKKVKIWQRYFGDINLVDRPCPACGQLINTKKLNFEIQTIVPIDTNDPNSSISDDWNYLPLCSKDESDGWGCSEKLERYRVEREMEMTELEDKHEDQDQNNENRHEGDEKSEENRSPSLVHLIDWILHFHPLKLHEISIRLQIAYGDLFGLTAGESLCLRFVRDVYGTGQALLQMNPKNSFGNWEAQNVGYVSDILDIADTYSSHTDREMMNIIEMKRKLSTPLSHRKGGGGGGCGGSTSLLSSPAILLRRSQPSTPLLFSSPIPGQGKGGGRMSEKKSALSHHHLQGNIQEEEENVPMNEARI